MRAALAGLVAVTAACGGGGDAPAVDAGDGQVDATVIGPDGDPPVPPDAAVARKPIVVLMIGDGMGPGQLEAASWYAHGAPGQLFMESLPARGQLRTGSLSGITDSAAAATTMATGERTYNGRIGQDRGGEPVETLVERAHALGLGAGVVSTASVTHATPASFTAHADSRASYVEIADDQALLVKPDVMLGGGLQYYLPAGAGSVRQDMGLIAPLEGDGYDVVYTAGELAASTATRLVGLFAFDHMSYVFDRAPDTTQPTLSEMSLAALRVAEQHERGFFLMIEGARIDMASHGNDLVRTVGETLAFDDAVRAVVEWAETRDDVTVIVTADHECGGLTVLSSSEAGSYPTVDWRWGQHTNARVDVFATGRGAEIFAGTLHDHVTVYHAARQLLAGEDPVAVDGPIVPDGHLEDLRWLAAEQTTASAFGVGWNQLERLRVDADEHGLGIGVEGVFEWGQNAVVVLVDADLGLSTGPAQLRGALSDTTGRVDAIAASLNLDAPAVTGFGVDYVAVTWGGSDARREDLIDDAGLRGTRPPYDLPWLGAATNFGEGVRVEGAPGALVPGEGYEIHLPWYRLYPTLEGAVPPGAAVGIAVVLVNDDGGYTSNQALPPWPAGFEAPGRTPVPLPGIVRFVVDSDADGVGDGDAPPALLP